MRKAIFCNANLKRVDFTKTDLSRAVFANPDLRETNLSGARLHKTWLLGCNMEEMDLRGADLRDVHRRALDRAVPRCKARFALGASTVYKPAGCNLCRNTGFRGRLGIFEFLPITVQIVSAIYDRRSSDDIRRLSGRPTLLDDGIAKVRSGLTTLDEILRVTA